MLIAGLRSSIPAPHAHEALLPSLDDLPLPQDKDQGFYPLCCLEDCAVFVIYPALHM